MISLCLHLPTSHILAGTRDSVGAFDEAMLSSGLAQNELIIKIQLVHLQNLSMFMGSASFPIRPRNLLPIVPFSPGPSLTAQLGPQDPIGMVSAAAVPHPQAGVADFCKVS